MKGMDMKRLSPFQRMMREWSVLAPYNGIHAMRLPGPARADRWQTAIISALHPLGFDASTIAIEQPATDFETHVEAELNRAFSRLEAPLRFFIIDAKPNDHWIGVVFDHWIADDFSCRSLADGDHFSTSSTWL